jgi:uridine kinase
MLIVSLSGGSGSGKTTIASQIASKLPKGLISILPMDAYYKDHSHLTQEQKEQHNFDHPDSIDFDLLIDHLHKLKLSLPIERPVYSYITCSREKDCIKTEPTEIIIIEGLMALANKKLRQETNLKIFIDVCETIRLERILERDMAERGRTRKLVMERFYKTVQPMHEDFIEPCKLYADVIIDGNNQDVSAITTLIVQVIGKHLYHHNCNSLL